MWCELICVAETGFGSHPDQKLSRPPSSTHTPSCSLRHLSQISADQKHRVPPSSCPGSGPHSTARFGANTGGDDCAPHNVRKDMKPSTKPMSLNHKHFHTWRVSHLVSCGQTSFCAANVKYYTDLDNSCKWSKRRHFIDADI